VPQSPHKPHLSNISKLVKIILLFGQDKMFSYLQNKVSLPTLESFSRATANYTIKVILGLRESELDMLFDELKIPALDRSAIRLVLKDLEQTHPGGGVGSPQLLLKNRLTILQEQNLETKCFR